VTPLPYEKSKQMRIAIMQPTYIPWAGYFNLISKAQTFVFLDDVQFAASSWQQRNRIIFNGQTHMLTVPVLVKGRPEQLIRETLTDETQKWRQKHLSVLRQAYSRHPHGKAATEVVEGVLKRPTQALAEINIGLIEEFCRCMEIPLRRIRSSELNLGGKKSAHVVEICRHFQADTYLSAAGSRDYIEEEGLLSAADLRVLYQNFAATPYPQLGAAEFVSHMSIVDIAANIGFAAARAYVDSHEF
jgi:hypothetical protein